MGRYASSHSRTESLKQQLQKRGYTVRTRQCRKFNCEDCHGTHFSVRGNGIVKNNLTYRAAQELLQDVD